MFNNFTTWCIHYDSILYPYYLEFVTLFDEEHKPFNSLITERIFNSKLCSPKFNTLKLHKTMKRKKISRRKKSTTKKNSTRK